MGFGERVKKFFGLQQQVDDELFENLADLLVEGDFGAAEAFSMAETLQNWCKKHRIHDPQEVRAALGQLLEDTLLRAHSSQKEGPSAGPAALSLDPAQYVPWKEAEFLESGKLAIILILGVNGVGKTTTAAKLAARYRQEFNRRPILAAADTFRAAAIDQLKIHGERLNIRVIAHKQGGDPAAVVYDAADAALAGGGDLIIADTAGRMHTKTALVEELKKIDRVVESRASGAEYIKWLVLDATTGRNALAQADIFHQAVSLDGAILTKYDSTARGGVVFSLAQDLHIPMVYLCNGEGYDTIMPFDPKGYAQEFVALE